MIKTPQDLWSDFRVGLITFVAVFVLIGGLVFAGGEKGIIFRKTATVKAYLPDVGGLKKGCSVTMGGMSVGQVMKIGFAAGNHPNPIEVMMEIRTDVLPRIKSDAVPSVRTQGMLGDRYIDISMGGERTPPLPVDGYLVGNSATNFDATLTRATDVLDETQKILQAVNKQQGTAGKLLYDEKFYNMLVKLSEELNDLVKDVKIHPRKYLKFSVF